MRILASSLVLGALILAGQGLTPAATSAEAASFDCTRARAADERAICGNRALEDRDVEMATLYGLIVRLVPMGTRDLVRREQAQWLTQRGRCGAGVACIRRSYDGRIAALRRLMEERVMANGPF